MKIINGLKNFLNNKILFVIFFGILGLLSIGIAICSLKWLYGIDNQFLLYSAFLTDNFHLLPYRDFFANQMPLVFFIYFVLTKIFGYSYLGLRIADLLFLFTFLGLTFLLLKKISLRMAWSSIITFSLVYFIGGNNYSFQRDFILLLPILISILYTYSYPKKSIRLKSFVMGFCCSISSLIKPNAIIIFPVLFIFILLINSDENSKIISLKNLVPFIYSCIGFLIPVIITILYLLITDSFKSFWEIQTNFNVIYRNSKMYIAGDPYSSIDNVLMGYLLKLERFRPFLIPASIGFCISVFRSELDRRQRLLIWQFALLSVLFILYVIIAGKFLYYHWIPFAYFIIILSSTCFVKPVSTKKYSTSLELIALLSIFFIITFQIFRPQNIDYFKEEFSGKGTGNDNLHSFYPNINYTANYLRTNLKPGDKVLSLDDIGTGFHAMLLAKAEMATYYPFEALFSFAEREFPNSEYLHRIHSDYMNKFKMVKPKFVLEFSRSKHFDDLQQILNTNYTATELGYGVLYERKPDSKWE